MDRSHSESIGVQNRPKGGHLQVGRNHSQRSPRNQTEVCGARRRTLGFGLKLLANFMEVELLLPKAQGLTAPLENQEDTGQGAFCWRVPCSPH